MESCTSLCLGQHEQFCRGQRSRLAIAEPLRLGQHIDEISCLDRFQPPGGARSRNWVLAQSSICLPCALRIVRQRDKPSSILLSYWFYQPDVRSPDFPSYLMRVLSSHIAMTLPAYSVAIHQTLAGLDNTSNWLDIRFRLLIHE